MDERPEQPPEGKLIATAMKRSGLSGRQAADRAGISEGRWRQIVHGYQTPARGVHVPVTAPPDTLARMAQVVGLTPEQLAEAGRDDAAAELRELGAYEEPVEKEPSMAEMAARVAETNARVQAMAEQIESLQRQLNDERADRHSDTA